MRSTNGMVDTLLWLLKAGVQQKSASDEKVSARHGVWGCARHGMHQAWDAPGMGCTKHGCTNEAWDVQDIHVRRVYKIWYYSFSYHLDGRKHSLHLEKPVIPVRKRGRPSRRRRGHPRPRMGTGPETRAGRSRQSSSSASVREQVKEISPLLRAVSYE